MIFRFYPPSYNDISFYNKCLSNQEFHSLLYGDKSLNLTRYLSKEDGVIKYVGSIKKTLSYYTFGFAHFYPIGSNSYSYVGGIDPDYFNKGIGVFASTAMLNHILCKSYNVDIITKVFKHNDRALKILLKQGFKYTGQIDDRYALILKYSDFQNEFVMRILSKVESYFTVY